MSAAGSPRRSHFNLRAALCTLACCPFAARAATPEVELSLGVAHDAESSEGVSAPAVSLRVGADFGALTPSLRALAVVGSEARDAPGGSNQFDPSGFQAWQALGELRAHGDDEGFQLHLAVAGGVGKLLGSQCACIEHLATRGRLAFSWRLSAGARYFVTDSFWLGAELSVSGWNQVFVSTGPRESQRLSAEPHTLPAVLVLFSLGLRPRAR